MESSSAKIIIIFGQVGKDAFASQYGSCPDNGIMEIGGMERQIIFLRRPEHTGRYASKLQLRELASKLRCISQSDLTVDWAELENMIKVRGEALKPSPLRSKANMPRTKLAIPKVSKDWTCDRRRSPEFAEMRRQAQQAYMRHPLHGQQRKDQLSRTLRALNADPVTGPAMKAPIHAYWEALRADPERMAIKSATLSAAQRKVHDDPVRGPEMAKKHSESKKALYASAKGLETRKKMSDSHNAFLQTEQDLEWLKTHALAVRNTAEKKAEMAAEAALAAAIARKTAEETTSTLKRPRSDVDDDDLHGLHDSGLSTSAGPPRTGKKRQRRVRDAEPNFDKDLHKHGGRWTKIHEIVVSDLCFHKETRGKCPIISDLRRAEILFHLPNAYLFLFPPPKGKGKRKTHALPAFEIPPETDNRPYPSGMTKPQFYGDGFVPLVQGGRHESANSMPADIATKLLGDPTPYKNWAQYAHLNTKSEGKILKMKLYRWCGQYKFAEDLLLYAKSLHMQGTAEIQIERKTALWEDV